MLDRKSHVPLYIQLVDEIKLQIQNGTIKVGDKLPSESEMLDKYDIGRLTVRDALTQLVHDGFLEKRHGVGTFCIKNNFDLTPLNIDVLLNMSDAYFIPYYMRSISKVLTEHHANFIVNDTRNSDSVICALLNKILENGSSGIIIQPRPKNNTVSNELVEVFRKLRLRGIPYIMIDDKYDNIISSYLIMDDEKAGHLAAQHFIDLNHIHLATISLSSYHDSCNRLIGFQKCLKQNNLVEAYEIKYSSKLKEEIQNMLIQNPSITGIFCYNDELAIRCINILNEFNVKVPDKISIIGVDDTLIASTSYPALTTISHPKDILSETATLALLDIINNTISWPYIKVYDPKLVIRDSCKKLST